MPNMTGLDFLKLVRTRHPDTVRMMLTGHADMQTAIDAINHGEIYRFLTKPWDDTELKVTLFLAFEQLDLERENRRLLAMVRRQHNVIKSLEKDHPGIGNLARDASGAIVIDELVA
jgi:DNA-binding NtrC family response regulator